MNKEKTNLENENSALSKGAVSGSLPLTDSDEWFINNLKCIIDLQVQLVKNGRQICIDRVEIKKWIWDNVGNDR